MKKSVTFQNIKQVQVLTIEACSKIKGGADDSDSTDILIEDTEAI